ncbi:Tetratricopeptide TPR_2 repeat protein [Anaeromyxobacter dehalogenans 2CP-1]|uniref:Tetratricopeptide TPR_2 repeat protein n=1 Tax=Anaeromyxobacter dehalogenans (strain ATCC BAA-258 / DSM 21875 / 2CP-1) TaxID=455488 RepID=B8J8J1_ANAD2|nr:tetratricopeptide repeat protein [Anaeromyxobacter dehalogenans]ACL67277.1 Tetratricopeptide TPR_2 repeat protein [Anaeromyxobacter dehalogenans 2CP-1]
MATILEKYEQILAADPRSRIFVELARALLERGQHARAIEICRQGLEHHPSSILGRVIWGRALLESGDTKDANDQFEIAIAVDPGSPYAYNLVGEALVAKGLFREALPVLLRAVELQPADARVRGWLEQAKRGVREDGAAPGAEDTPAPARAAAPDEVTEPYRPLADEPPKAEIPPELEATATFELPPRAAPRPRTAASPTVAPAPPVLAREPGRAPPADGGDAALEAALAFDVAYPRNAALPADEPLDAPAAPASAVEPPDADEPLGRPAEPASSAPAAPAPPRPPPIRATPPPLARDELPASLLSLIPGPPPRGGAAAGAAMGAPAARARPATAPTPDAAEAERIAAEYEREVRERLLAAPEPPPSFLRRHRRAVLAGAAVFALLAGAAVYLVVDARVAARNAVGAAARARAGLARDTAGSLAEAARLLAEARRFGAGPEVTSLAAQVAAVRAAEFGDDDARALASGLMTSDAAGDGALAARWLLAEQPGERAAAEAAILSAPPSSEPLVQALAGRILAGRGEREASRGRLEIAAHANPPLLRALSDLGDAALAAGDAEGALATYAAVLSAHATHPRSVVGAAEARLALGRDLDAARASLAAVEADAGSAPPRDLCLRFELASARVLAATGDAAGAAARLARAAQALGDSAPLAAALADVHLAARAWDRAETAAARAVALAPKDEGAKVLLARARIGRGRLLEALAATDGAEGRAVRVQRAIARYRLGQYAAARAELERTARDGRMPAEAAVWYALTDVAQGRAARGRTLLEKLAATRSPPPLAHVALGRALEAEGRADDAEKAYQDAMTREPRAPEPALALGDLLLRRGRATDALPVLEKAVALDPAEPEARRALGAARLAGGEPSAARAELDAVLLARPKDAAALRLLSAAWLAESQPAEARRAAERGLAVAPRDPALLLAGARAAQADGDRAVARALAERALKAGARGEDAAEARLLAATQTAKRR